MAGVKPTGPDLEGNPPRRSPPPDSGKPEAQSVPQSFDLILFSQAKLPKWPSIDIIAVHGSREDVNSTWTWRDTSPKNPTGSAKSDGTSPRNPASKQGESGATVPGGNPASKQGESDATVPGGNPASRQGESGATVPEGSRASRQGESGATVPEGSRASRQGDSDATVPEGSPAPKQGESNATVPGGNPASRQGESGATVPEGSRASRQGESGATVPEGSRASRQGDSDATVPEGSPASKQGESDATTSHKPCELDEKALDTRAPPETSVPQSGKAEKTTPEVKGPQSNISWGEKVKRGLSLPKPSMADSSKKLESKSTKHESGGEPSKRDPRFQFPKPPPKKTASAEPLTEDSHRNSEQSPQRESPATVGTDPKSAPAKGRKQSVANDQGGEPRELNWLKDDKMLPTALPECRILGFRYPTTLQPNTPDQNVLKSLAQGFLEVIEKRWEVDSPRRAPIIFIGHELGCLIIAKALSTDALPDEKRKLLLSLTAAVIFWATPFPDSGSKEGVVKLTSKVLDRLETGLDLVRGHRPIPVHEVMENTAELHQLLDSFADLVGTNGIPVVCFNSKSPDSSQSKPKEEDTKFKSIGFDKTTNGICKFRGRIDGDYVKVRDKLREFVDRRQMRDAVLAKDDRVLEMLLKARRNVELQDEFGRTPLQIAVMNGRCDTTRLLLGQGTANIDHRDKDGFTALHHAVSQAANKGQDDLNAQNLIKVLLDKGADVEMEDNDGRTAWKDRPTWLLVLKRQRPLVEGASKPVTVGLKTPIALSTKEAITACMGFRATMMEFYNIGEGEKYRLEKASIMELIYNPTKKLDAILSLARPVGFDEKPLCRWYHIPANNETWVQDLFAKLEVLLDPMCEHRHGGHALHSRFMRPQAKKIEYWKQMTNSQQTTAKGLVPNSQQTTAEGLVPNPQKPDETGKSDMVLYIPFLSFETSSSREQMTEIMQNMYAPRKTDPNQRDDESLIKAYSEFLHPRRTLDQFYYYMLENTETRDKWQVMQTWLDRRRQSKTYVMMADQLWLWIINDNTVVTSFAEPWGESRERDSFDVLEGFIEYMKRKDRSPVKSGHDLAMKIVKHCLNAYNTCHPPGVKFHDVFQMFINSVANQETNLFKNFQRDSKELTRGEKTLDSEKMAKLRDSLFNINDETDQLKDVKHILAELNIVLTMLKEQKDVLSKMSNDFPHISCPESIVDNNIKRVEKMEKHADNTCKALNHLLDLKQKQANGWEARFARKQSEQSARQGNIILLFTIVTIIFLPLTFMSSFFAINIAQFPKDSTGNSTEWQLSHISKYLFGVSFATSALFILIAINANTVKEVWTRWGHGRHRGVQWAGFHSIIPFFIRWRRRREVHLSYMDLEDPHYSYVSISSQDQIQDKTTGCDPDALERGVGLHWRGKEKTSESDEE